MDAATKKAKQAALTAQEQLGGARATCAQLSDEVERERASCARLRSELEQQRRRADELHAQLDSRPQSRPGGRGCCASRAEDEGSGSEGAARRAVLAAESTPADRQAVAELTLRNQALSALLQNTLPHLAERELTLEADCLRGVGDGDEALLSEDAALMVSQRMEALSRAASALRSEAERCAALDAELDADAADDSHDAVSAADWSHKSGARRPLEPTAKGAAVGASSTLGTGRASSVSVQQQQPPPPSAPLAGGRGALVAKAAGLGGFGGAALSRREQH